jgi:hypothetical protein
MNVAESKFQYNKKISDERFQTGILSDTTPRSPNVQHHVAQKFKEGSAITLFPTTGLSHIQTVHIVNTRMRYSRTPYCTVLHSTYK